METEVQQEFRHLISERLLPLIVNYWKHPNRLRREITLGQIYVNKDIVVNVEYGKSKRKNESFHI